MEVSGAVIQESNPYPGPSNSSIFVFDEQQGVPFVGTQGLNFGHIADGVLVDSHYLQYDPASPTGAVGGGSVTFDGEILGLITSTRNLNAFLSPEVFATSDTYFGLESTLGGYPAGAPGTERFRGLGSAGDILSYAPGSATLMIKSFDVPFPGALDGVRILTASKTTSAEAVQRLIALLEDSGLHPIQPFLAKLNAALASIERGSSQSARGQLGAFQNQVKATVTDADSAANLLNGAATALIILQQEIGQPATAKIRSLHRKVKGATEVHVAGLAGQTYLLETSPNCVDWKSIGTVTPGPDGVCVFEDAETDQVPCRFYRVRELP